jgi:hypothetical protein
MAQIRRGIFRLVQVFYTGIQFREYPEIPSVNEMPFPIGLKGFHRTDHFIRLFQPLNQPNCVEACDSGSDRRSIGDIIYIYRPVKDIGNDLQP